jgi:hypothetical protein
MDSSKLKGIIIFILAGFAALYLGITAATAQLETVAWVLGVIVLTTCVLLGRRVWLLIPFLASLDLTLRIPGQPSTLLLSQILFLGFTSLMLLMRKIEFRIHFTELEFWILLLALFVLQVFMRNPVSVSLFGGDTVGGKAYYIFAISFVSAVFLSGLRIHPHDLNPIVPLTIFGGLLNILLIAIGAVFPQVGVWYGAAAISRGTNIEQSAMEGVSSDTGAVTQRGDLGPMGANLALWLSAFVSPLRACFSLRWAPLLLLAAILSTMSGYRNAIATLGLTLIIGICYRGGRTAALAAFLIAACGVGLLAFVNLVMPLPPNMQRSLAFLPGTWEERYVKTTRDSTEWRTEIWKEVLLTDRWINNKLLGDGLGFTAQELAMQMNIAEGKNSGRIGISGFDAHRETILANGDYHSGPVQTIRTIGYAGLLVLLIAQCRVAVHAHRQIQRCRNTEWFPLALLIGIPIIWAPIFFFFVFGTFKDGAASLLLAYGMIRILENNLPLPYYNSQQRRGHVPLAIKRHSAELQTARSA